MSDFHIRDLVVLVEDLREHGLAKGFIGGVYALLENGDLEVEIPPIGRWQPILMTIKPSQVEKFTPAVILDEATFWGFIEQAKVDSQGELDLQVKILEDRLTQLGLADIFAYWDVYNRCDWLANREDILQAVQLVVQGYGDFDFTYFRAWLIAHGHDVFYEVVKNPDALAQYLPEKHDMEIWHERMFHVHLEAHKRIRGDSQGYPAYKYHVLHLPKLPAFVDEKTPESELEAMFPRLSALGAM